MKKIFPAIDELDDMRGHCHGSAITEYDWLRHEGAGVDPEVLRAKAERRIAHPLPRRTGPTTVTFTLLERPDRPIMESEEPQLLTDEERAAFRAALAAMVVPKRS